MSLADTMAEKEGRMILHDELKRFSSVVWNTGNFWGRIVILLWAGYPILVALVRVMGGGIALTASLAFMPFLTLVIVLSIAPLISIAAAKMKWSGNIVKWTISIVGFELVIGGSFAMVPLANDWELVPILLVVIAAIVMLKISKTKTAFMPLLWVALVVLTIIFIAGGREKAIGLIPKGSGQQDTAPPPTPQGYMENGYYVPDVRFTIGPKVRAETYRKELLPGREFEMVIDCRDMDQYVVTIPPGKTAQIRHIDYGPYEPKKSSCSYGFGNYRAPVNGTPGMVARPRFEEDFFFTDVPPLVTAFYIENMRGGKSKTPDHIKKLGGSVYFTNPTQEDMEVHVQKNLTQALYADKLTRDGIGWDGSTEKFHVTILDP